MAVHLEDVIEETGGCGRFQVFLCLIVHTSKTYLCFGLLFMVIGAKVPEWWCADDLTNQTTSAGLLTTNSSGYQSCTNQNGTTCQNFIFDTSTASIIPQWELVCDNDWVTATILSVQMAGVFLGNFAGGQIADLVGRKPPYYAALGLTTVSMIIAIFSTSWQMFAVMRFLIGASIGVFLTVMYSIQTEFVLPRWRTWIVALPSWYIGSIIFALVSWGLEDWKYIHAVGAATGMAAMLSCWYIPESFRWKVAHNHIEDAEHIIKFVAKVNKAPAPSTQMFQDVANSVRSTASHGDRKYSILDLFKSKATLKNTILLLIVWITLGLGSYGIQFGIQAMSGIIYVNLIIVAVITSPMQFVLIYLQNRFGRKKTNILFFFVFTAAAVAVGVIVQLEESDVTKNASRICTLIALIFINAVWSPVQTHTIELYPTVVRNIGYGLQNTVSNFGAVIGPQLVLLEIKWPGTMYFVCAALGVLTIIAILPLPETNKRDLQDNLPGHVTNPTQKTPIEIKKI